MPSLQTSNGVFQYYLPPYVTALNYDAKNKITNQVTLTNWIRMVSQMIVVSWLLFGICLFQVIVESLWPNCGQIYNYICQSWQVISQTIWVATVQYCLFTPHWTQLETKVSQKKLLYQSFSISFLFNLVLGGSIYFILNCKSCFFTKWFVNYFYASISGVYQLTAYTSILPLCSIICYYLSTLTKEQLQF